MNVGDLWNACRQIKYKPGWRLTLNASSDQDLGHIRWEMVVPDANDPSLVRKFHSAWVTKALSQWDEEGLVREAFRLAVRSEEHEAGEFFTYKNKRPFDPHRSVINKGARYG